MKKLLFLVLFTWTCSFGQEGAYPLYIQAKDASSGSQIEAKFIVKPAAGGAEAKIETKAGNTIAYLRTAEKYFIQVLAEGYKEEKVPITIETDADPKQPRSKIISLTSVASAHLIIKAIDDKTGEAVPANFDIAVPDIFKNLTAITTKERASQRVVISGDKPKVKASIKAIAQGYAIASESVDLEISDPPKATELSIKLKRLEYNIRFNVTDIKEQPISRLKITIREVGAVNPMAIAEPKNGTLSAIFKYGKSYRVMAEAPGYVSQEKTYLDRDGDTEIGIQLASKFEANFRIFALDGTQKVPAYIRVSSARTGTVGELTETDSTGLIKINQQGVYKIEAMAKGFQNALDELIVDELTANKITEKTIKLERTVREYVLRVVKKNTNDAIADADLKIKGSDGKAVVVKKNIQTGGFSAILKDDLTYEIEANAPDFIGIKEQLRKSDRQIVIGLTENIKALSIRVIDKFTRQAVDATVKVLLPETDPLVAQTTANKPMVTFNLNPGKNYPIEISSPDYNPFKLNLDTEKPEYTIEIERKSYPYTFVAIDATSKIKIENAQFQFADKKKSSENLTQGNGEKMILTVGEKYNLKISAEGYNPTTLEVNLAELFKQGMKKEVPLIKKIAQNHNLIIVENGTKKTISNSQVEIFSDKGKLEVKSTSEGEFVFMPDETQNYSINVKAEGFVNFSGGLPLVSSKSYTIELKRVPPVGVTLATIDAISKKEVLSKLEIKLAKKKLFDGRGTKHVFGIMADNNYDALIEADGYLPMQLPLNTAKFPNSVLVVELKKDAYSFTFKVVDALTKEPLNDAKLRFNNITKKQALSPRDQQNGVYFIDLKPEFTYDVTADRTGYDPFTIRIDAVAFSSGQNFDIEIPIKIRKEPLPAVVARRDPPPTVQLPKVEIPKVVEAKPIELPKEVVKPVKKPEIFEDLKVGKVLLLENIYFDQGSYILKKESEPQLNKLYDAMKSQPNLKIEIAGHTDNQGNEALNRNLSYFRAKVMANYLFNKGIQDERISVSGYGSARSVAPNDVEENRAKNRRIEVVIKEY